MTPILVGWFWEIGEISAHRKQLCKMVKIFPTITEFIIQITKPVEAVASHRRPASQRANSRYKIIKCNRLRSWITGRMLHSTPCNICRKNIGVRDDYIDIRISAKALQRSATMVRQHTIVTI
ncbi:hypothetical protein TSA66_15235 [Noviherbaspirillum autotrophicum]|uniref:Uncharacterized protein n=1 Tax=Noviherbaspirillum autotrophicum TaxID=709839 RepID=A0A0C2BKT1_9BURK|nr:hypothetical protein TSA66_15235 [Noviherbaspirillum autotrophicum]